MRNGRLRHITVAMMAVALSGMVWLWGRSAGRHEAQRLEEARNAYVLPAHDELGATVRMLLHGRMGRHAAGAERLWNAFVAVDYTAMAKHATELAAEPRLGQPADDEDPALINTVIPPAFFTYQDDLARSATALASAASQGDASRVLATFQRTAASCFSCHLHYRMGERHAVAP